MTNKISRKKPETDGVDRFRASNGLKFNPKELIDKASISLNKLHLTEKEKMDSGEFEWVTIKPQFGKEYKTLKRKK